MRTTKTRPSLSAAEFDRFRDLVRRTSGLDFGEPRRSDLERAVARALIDTESPTTDALYEHLTDHDAGRTTLEGFLAALTIGETHFFRNRAQMQALEKRILPELVERKSRERRLRLWSAGCATGEEPYSLAILLERLVPDLESWNVTILATDLNRRSLDKARRGIYTSWSFREVPADIERGFFNRGGARIEIAPRIRERVTFSYLNLVDDVYPSLITNTQSMDLILCRNVLMYFQESTVRSVVNRFHDALIDGGWLVVGAAEPSQSLFGAFVTHNLPRTVVYQKRQVPTPREARPTEQPKPHRADPAPARPAGAAGLTRRSRSSPHRGRKPRETVGKAKRAVTRPAPSSAVGGPGLDDAVALWRDGHAEQALRLVSAIAEAEPENGSAPYVASKIQASRLKFDEAAGWAAVALEREPLLAAAHYVMGLVMQELERPHAALESLRRCVYADPDFVLGHVALAGLFGRAGERVRAEKALRNAESLLANRDREELVVEGDGVRVGRLLEIVAVQRELLG